MLAKIREKTQGIIATFILALVAIPFMLWGIGSYFEGGSEIPVAEVNGTEISQQMFRDRLDEIQGKDPTRKLNSAMKRLILDNLIDQNVLLAEVQDSGYRTSDAQLAQIIKEVPYFQQEGKFQPALYHALLRQRGMNAADFEAGLRRDNLAVQVLRGMSESAFAPEADVNRMLQLLLQERRFSYATIKASAFVPHISVSDQEIKSYYTENPDAFRTDETVRVEYVKLTVADIAKQIKPTEEELRQAYANDEARYVTPEKRKASHILIEVPSDSAANVVKAARKRAEDLLKQLHNGANFAALAKKYSNDTETGAKGGDLGYVKKGGVLPRALENAIYALKPGQVSGVVSTQFGFHIAKLTAYTPAKRRSFEAAKSEIEASVRKSKAEGRFYEAAERLRNLAYENPDSLEVPSKQLDLHVETTGWFTRAGGTGIVANPHVVSAAFEPEVLSRERNSDVIEINPETLVALHVSEHRPSEVRPLTEVRSTIENRLKKKHAYEQARATAEKWVEKLREGKNLKALAHEPGVTLEGSKTATRIKPGAVNPRILEAVFAAQKPESGPVYNSVDLPAEGAVIFALEAVKEGDPKTADAALKERARKQVLRRLGSDYYVGYRTGLRKVADVTINEDQL